MAQLNQEEINTVVAICRAICGENPHGVVEPEELDLLSALSGEQKRQLWDALTPELRRTLAEMKMMKAKQERRAA